MRAPCHAEQGCCFPPFEAGRKLKLFIQRVFFRDPFHRPGIHFEWSMGELTCSWREWGSPHGSRAFSSTVLCSERERGLSGMLPPSLGCLHEPNWANFTPPPSNSAG